MVVRAEAKRDVPSAVRPEGRRPSGVADDGKPHPRKPGGPTKTRSRGAAAAELAAKQPMFAERRNLAVWRSTSALPFVPPSNGPVSNISPGPGFGGQVTSKMSIGPPGSYNDKRLREDIARLSEKVDALDEKLTKCLELDHTDTAVADAIHRNLIATIKGLNPLLEKDGLNRIRCFDRQ